MSKEQAITPEQIDRLIDVCQRQSEEIVDLKERLEQQQNLSQTQQQQMSLLLTKQQEPSEQMNVHKFSSKAAQATNEEQALQSLNDTVKGLFVIDALAHADNVKPEEYTDKVAAINKVTTLNADAKSLQVFDVLSSAQEALFNSLNVKMNKLEAERKTLDNVVTTFGAQHSAQFPVMHAALMKHSPIGIKNLCRQDPAACNATLDFKSPALLGLTANDINDIKLMQRSHALDKEQFARYDAIGKEENNVLGAVKSIGRKCEMASNYIKHIVPEEGQ